MKKVIIHIGPPKTGTSALQYCLNANRPLLEENGIWYPKHDLDSNLVSSGNKLRVLSRSKLPAETPSNNWRIEEQKVARLLDEFSRSPCSRLLLSSEFFWAKVPGLQKAFGNPQFVAYFRNPIELIESNYNQGVKRHRQTRPFTVNKNVAFGSLNTLRRWFLSTEPPLIDLRPYCAPLYEGGSLESDFIHYLEIFDKVVVSDRINDSYSFEALEFKRYANHFELDALEQELDRALQACPLGLKDYSLIPPQIHNHLSNRFICELDKFIQDCSRVELEPYREVMSFAAQKTFRKQEVDDASLAMISDYLREETPSLYNRLRSLVMAASRPDLPNNAFYQCMETRAKERKALIPRLMRR